MFNSILIRKILETSRNVEIILKKKKNLNQIELKYKIAITLLKGIGVVKAKQLISFFGNPENIFNEKFNILKKIQGFPSGLKAEDFQNALKKAENEIKFIEKNEIEYLFYTDKKYPNKLKLCNDAPLGFFCKGDTENFNIKKSLAIVGTRNATEYGKKHCEEIVDALAGYDIFIYSGLAYGIDICAHQSALKNNIPTFGVLGHGLDSLYPAIHRETAVKMIKNGGGLITEYFSGTGPDRNNFPERNRIIAGISDAILVVEAGKKGGALITAEIADSYNRDVFAFPGRVGDKYSEGCNNLIKTNKAALVENIEDILYYTNWEKPNTKKEVQASLFDFGGVSDEELVLLKVLQEKGKIPIDLICYHTGFDISKTSMILLNLEFNGTIKSLPGKIYCIK